MQIMKKFLTIITLVLMSIMSIDVNAQTTFNLRAGVSSTPSIYDGWGNNDEKEDITGGSVAFQANIPINLNGTLTVSPTALLSAQGLNPEEDHFSLGFPIYLGYKIMTGYKSIFYPKIGPAIYASDDYFAGGLSVELAQECKHFIIAANYLRTFLSDEDITGNCIYFTLGYKF